MYVMSGNPNNTVLDPEYAEKLIQYFRDMMGFEIKPDSKLHKALSEFSKRYSEEKRDVVEVAYIFRMAVEGKKDG